MHNPTLPPAGDVALLRDGRSARSDHRSVLFHALPIAVLALALFYYWFVIADRFTVFLYNHDMGLPAADTAPFGRVTASRYWMTGLVAGGFVALYSTGVSWLVGRLRLGYRPPRWWQVVVVAGAPLLVGVPAITMTANAPTLPVLYAAQTTLTALVGMGLAVAPSHIAARHPWRLFWLVADGWAIGSIVLIVSLSERARPMLERGSAWALLVLVVVFVGAVGLLLATTALIVWRRLWVPKPLELFVAGLCVVYLGLPLLHHVAFTDGYHYIPDADNYFASSLGLQVVAWIVGALVALGTTAFRTALVDRLNRERSVLAEEAHSRFHLP